MEVDDTRGRKRVDVIYLDEGGNSGGPQYELFSSRLKEGDISSVVGTKVNGLEHQGKQESEREMVCVSNNRAALVQNGCIVEYEYATVLRSVKVVKGDKELIEIDKYHFSHNHSRRNDCVEENPRVEMQMDKEYFHQKTSQRNDEVKEDPCELVEIDKAGFCKKTSHQNDLVTENLCPWKKKARHAEVDKDGHGVLKRAVVQIDNEQLCRLLGTSRLARKESECDGEVRNKVLDLVQVDDEANHKSKEKMHGQDRDIRVMKRISQVQLGKEPMILAVKDEPNHTMKTCRQIRECAKCSIKFEINDEQHLEGEVNCKTVPADIQILDIAEKGVSFPFVSSKKFHRSMVDEESPGFPSASDKFREEVLRILQQPFDKVEYRKHREAIEVGSYLDHHPDVKRKLKTYKHKRGKCLTILRGFFYWLQNLTREGAFQPWTDKQCLAVDPPSS